MKRVLITGASGLLGRAVIKKFQSEPEKWNVYGTAFKRATQSLHKLDLTDEKEVFKTVSKFKPDVIIHCAAERRPDIVENNEEASYKLNVEATIALCKAAVESSSWLLYISTDYVFDGTSPPYNVTDAPNPLNKYGLSKLQGEKAVQNISSDFAILRVPILYGQVEFLEESAVTILLKSILNSGVTSHSSHYERRYPTHCDDLASLIMLISEKKCFQQEKISGVFHWSGNDNMTKYDMMTAMADIFSLDMSHIVADDKSNPSTKRPYNAHLSSERLENLGINVDKTPFRNGIKDVLCPFVSS
ncbi:methionine adenosyltransferase 2 subunit beta [Octopus sinensis]|uniref:Methionine adenosyltransferase 2 subunit beta n=1 Tax=Octopus sinensis TaxID=2607531 RepID=A0A6P7SDQ6_9MOLL|nr:methionine adenosyltransferase 2 subunit beta [Octopus sinensis]XP_029636535.1 methionine adenosyltransferase 2 subunit beta [Octopus sinensis]XP_029636536.1 methionine adenosyltransferase 2 subunit beta [Octopus sinensis]XP_036359238.1 methionine adenosyltransferase 2 subunit beta [Octopus sinensis]